MESPIAHWHADHVYFRSLLALLQAEVDAFHAGERPSYELMLDIVSYLREFSDRLHHPREELAFQRLAARCPDLRGVVARLAREHHVIALAGQTLVDKLNAVLDGAVMPRGELEVAAATYLVYYGNHMALEEEAVLPRAATALTGRDWKQVRSATTAAAAKEGERFRAMRRELAAAHA